MHSNSWPVCPSHTLTSLPEPLARRLPSGLKATGQTLPVCPLRICSSSPVCPSHTLTVLSSAAARRLPSGLKATLESGQPLLVFTLRERSSRRVWASHTFTAPPP